MRRKTFRLLVTAVMAFILTVQGFVPRAAKDSDTLDFTFEMTGGQSEARLILDMINSVRTGGQAWYWNPDDLTKTTPGVLSALTYNYDLERVAMKRAAELAVLFSHTRPSGSSCFTAYSELGVSTSGVAENIAKGYGSVRSVFDGWMEEDKPYNGQGHRRSLLGNYASFGVGHVIYEGVHYWALELSGSSYVGTPTSPLDQKTSVTISVSSDDIDGIYVVPDLSDGRASLFDEDAAVLIGEEVDCRYTLSANCGETFTPSGYGLRVNAFGTDRTVTDSPGLSFASSAPDVVSISGNEVTALGEGVAVLQTSYLGYPISLPVIVSHDYDEGVIETQASCTEPGTIVYTCKGCGDAYVDVIPATGHKYTDYTVPATMEEDGAVGLVCENCGQTSDVEIIEKIGEISLKGTVFAFRPGKRIKPAVTANDASGETIDPSNYTVKYKGYAKVGTAKATVTFNDVLYSATKELEYVINPKATSFAKLTPKQGGIGFKWTRVLKQNTGYEIEYSTKKSFKKSEILIISDKNKKTFTLRGLKRKKMYYVRIRTFCVKDGVTYRSEWSGARTVRTG